MEQLEARRAHNPEVGSSSLPPATNRERGPLIAAFFFFSKTAYSRTYWKGCAGKQIGFPAGVTAEEKRPEGSFYGAQEGAIAPIGSEAT